MHLSGLARRVARRVGASDNARSSGKAPPARSLARVRLARVGLACLLLAATPALAQTTTPPWTLEVEHAEQPRTVVGTFETQEEAESALWDVPGPSDAEGAYAYVKSQKLLPVDGVNTTIVFTLGAEQPLDPEWGYWALGSDYVTEAAMLVGMEAFYSPNHEPSCGEMSIEPSTEWAAISP
ncbi:hypothetical protein [Marilutibacter maris]|uniref:hypothetical protein n=1 Tax=Marilutibacter maris TaxID=1605891 RepID=UPI0011AE17E2|nr:hypothetical protein [Lysobacter maris]